MRLLVEIAAATPTPAGGDTSGGFDPWKLLGIPAAIVAVLTLITTYVLGVIRPLAVKRPRYWHVGSTTRFSCVIRNRSFFRDTTVTEVSLVRAPGWVKRTFWPRWKRKAQVANLIPWDLPAMPKLGKRDEATLEAGLRKHGLDGAFNPDSNLRLLAHAGSRSSRSTQLKNVSG
jgi:hypothetical protein